MDNQEVINNLENMNRKLKKKKKKKKVIIITIITLLILLAGAFCYYYFFMRNDVKAPDNTPTEIKKLTVYDEDSNARPLAIMIDNNVGSSSHIGLQEAYLSYEIIVEGGLTRIMAIFKDKDLSTIGPVRSSRHYFLDYALESDAIYTHYGWSTYAENDIERFGVNNINGLYTEVPFWRDDLVDSPHDVFTSTSKLYSYADDLDYSLTSSDWKLLNYSTDEINLNIPTGTEKVVNPETQEEEVVPTYDENLITANEVYMDFSGYENRSYTYDPENKVYLRYMDDEPHTDRITGIQYNYKNVIVIYTSNTTLDSYNRQDVETTGIGKGYYITNGYAMPITWEKPSRTSKSTYRYPSGEEIILNDGNTFIEVLPSSRDVVFN